MKKLICLLLALITLVMTGCTGNAGNAEIAGNEATTEPTERRVGTPLVSLTISPEQDVTPEELAEMVEVMNISPYSGLYNEGLGKSRETDIYALKVTNKTDRTIKDLTLVYNDGTQDLHFRVEVLPAGRSLYVAEQEKKAFVSETLTYVQGEINLQDPSVENMEVLEITPTQLSTLMVKNLTNKVIPHVVIYYRKVVEDGTLLVGKVFSVEYSGLAPKEEVELDAIDFQNSSCIVVSVHVLDEVPETTEPDETTPE